MGATKEPSTHRLLGLPLEHGSSQLRIVVPDLYPRTRAARPQESGERMAAGPVGGQSYRNPQGPPHLQKRVDVARRAQILQSRVPMLHGPTRRTRS